MSRQAPNGALARHAYSLRLQAILRRINDEIAGRASDRTAAAFVCECDDRACVEAIELPLDLYSRLRLIPTRFAVRRDHVHPFTERLVTLGDTYAVVERSPRTGGADTSFRLASSGG